MSYSSSLESKIDNIEVQLTTTIQDVKSLTQDVGALKQDVGALKQDVGALKQDVRDLGVKLDSTIKDMGVKLELTGKDINLIEVKLEGRISEAKNQILFWVAGLLVANGVFTHFFK